MKSSAASTSYGRDHDALAAPAERGAALIADIHEIPTYHEIRHRYLRFGLFVTVAVNLFGLLDMQAPVSVQGVRTALALVGASGLLWARRSSDDRAIRYALSIGLAVGMLAIAFVRRNEGWPVNLTLLPLIVCFAALVADVPTAIGIGAGSVAAVLGMYALPSSVRPPYFDVQVSVWLAAVVLLTFFVRRIAALVAEVAKELSVSADGLAATQRDTTAMAEHLSTRVSGAVAQLAEAFRGSRDLIAERAEAVSKVLAESRTNVPSPVAIADWRYAEQLTAFRVKVMDWVLAAVVGTAWFGVVRVMMFGPRAVVQTQVGATIVYSMIGLLRLWRPAWRLGLFRAFYASACALGAVALYRWFARAPIAPPVMTTWLAASLMFAVTLGPVAAIAGLGVMVVVSLIGLSLHPGIFWTVPINGAIAYSAGAWLIWSLPNELVRVLGARRDAAIEGIRTRRRLVATMFHDLANPLMVVALEVEMLDGGPEDDERLASAHAMVRRMQATLESALSGRVVTTDVEVGRLADELAVLFRDRLRRKALSFDVNGPRLVRLRADEALLRDSVLANLVSNALKFSDAGSTIDFTIRPEPGRVILMLEDRGPGLPDDVATALQAGRGVPSRRGSHGETGSGNGLLLAHDYVAAMGGRLELLPRAGGGLSAIVTLPAA